MAGHEIVSVCFSGFPGANRHLREVSRASGLTRHVAISAQETGSPEMAFLRSYLEDQPVKLVIFGSWHATYEPLVEALAGSGAEVAVLWTSSATQTGLGSEASVLQALLTDRRIDRFLATSENMVRPLGASGRPSQVLPVAFALPAPRPEITKHRDSKPVVSLFCGPQEYRRKNVLCCLFGLFGLDLPYVLYVNGLSQDPEYRAYLEILRIPYRDLGWMSDDQYAEALDHVDLGLQVSLADSFNYVTAEHFARAIPVLVSRSVPCARGLSSEAARWLVVDDVDDPTEIQTKIRDLLNSPEDRRSVGGIARKHIEAVSRRNDEASRATLLALLGRG